MSNIDRPLSPHLQIYRPQITSMMSILHRITGAGLAIGALLVAGWLWAAMEGDDAFALVQQLRDHSLGKLMLFGWLFSFIYHFLNGIRHLKWDAGHGFDMKSVYRSGYIVMAGSVILSVLIWMGVKP